MKLAIIVPIFTLLFSDLHGHGLMTEPPQRGTLGGTKFARHLRNTFGGAPTDSFAHFPAGDKSTVPGAGKKSQERQVRFNWTPFEPMKKGFQWRSGVCGDLKSGRQDHLRGGKYYFDGTISRVYRQGGIVKIGMSIVAHHNGFIEMHVCDVRRCGGEISESCFVKGHCQILKRARNGVCDGGLSRNCAPIDRKFPGRWYLPCSRNPKSGFDMYSPEFAQFVLPAHLICDHCVLHWFWTSANTCNPPGVVEYFEGPDGPKVWGKCPGQAGALGGYTKVQKPCGGNRFPEEYYQCADIKITHAGARSGRGERRPITTKSEPGSSKSSLSQSHSSEPNKNWANKKKAKKNEKSMKRKKTPSQPTKPASLSSPRAVNPNKHSKIKGKKDRKKGPGNPVKNIRLIADGRTIKKLRAKETFQNLKFKKLTFKVNTVRPVKQMDFYIDGKKVWTEHTFPYYMFGNTGNMLHYWPSPIINRRFSLEVRTERHAYKVSLKFVKN